MKTALTKPDNVALPKGFVGVPQLSPFADWDYYYLRAPLKWFDSNGISQLQPVTAVTGFVCDLASIPRLFWSLLPKTARYTAPAIIHDYLYWEQPATHTRRQADDVFLVGMRELGVSGWKCWLIHKSVRLGGWTSWRSNRKARDLGERRVLRRFPSDVSVTWYQWRNDPTVFL
jgi:hypothetical protein